jgi:hypothetical protein
MAIRRSRRSCRLWRAGPGVLLLLTASCARLPTTASVTVPPIPAGEARVWFYRDDGPYETPVPAHLRMNDAVVGGLEPRGAFYRDATPGHYHVTVDNYLPDPSAGGDVDLIAGQQVYFKIVSLSDWSTGGGSGNAAGYSRPEFYVWRIPPAVAQGDVARSPYFGGS